MDQKYCAELARIRLERAIELLDESEDLLKKEKYKSANNRSYYQGDTDGLEYLYTKEDQIIRTDQLILKTLKMNKVRAIVQEIGRQPVLSFGNSSGDCSMHNYTIFNNRYKSAAFMLIADDEERDYGNTEKARELGEKWEEAGYHVISMKDDFRNIYGENVKKTGTFHWFENLAENREPAV